MTPVTQYQDAIPVAESPHTVLASDNLFEDSDEEEQLETGGHEERQNTLFAPPQLLESTKRQDGSSRQFPEIVDAIKSNIPLVNQSRNQYLEKEKREGAPPLFPVNSEQRSHTENETGNDSASRDNFSYQADNDTGNDSRDYCSSHLHDDDGYESGDEKISARPPNSYHDPNLHIRSHTATMIPEYASDTCSKSLPPSPSTTIGNPSRIGDAQQHVDFQDTSDQMTPNGSSQAFDKRYSQPPDFDPYNPQQYSSRRPSQSGLKVSNLHISNQSSPIQSPQHSSHSRRSSLNSITAPSQNVVNTPSRPSTSRSTNRTNSISSPTSSSLAKRKVSSQSLRSTPSKGFESSFSSNAVPDTSSSSSRSANPRQRPRSMTSGWDARFRNQHRDQNPKEGRSPMKEGKSTASAEKRPTMNPASSSFFRKTRSLFEGKKASASSSISGDKAISPSSNETDQSPATKPRPKSDFFPQATTGNTRPVGIDNDNDNDNDSPASMRKNRQASISSLRSVRSTRSSLYLVEGVDDIPATKSPQSPDKRSGGGFKGLESSMWSPERQSDKLPVMNTNSGMGKGLVKNETDSREKGDSDIE